MAHLESSEPTLLIQEDGVHIWAKLKQSWQKWELIIDAWHFRFSKRPESSNLSLSTMNDRAMHFTDTKISLCLVKWKQALLGTFAISHAKFHSSNMHLNNKLKRAQRRPSLQQTNSGNYILKNITIQSGNGCKWMLKFTIKLCIQQYLCTFTTDLWFPLPALNHTTGA